MKIVIATFPDWDGLYIDGVVKQEDNILYACDIVNELEDKLPCTIESIELKSVDETWFHNWFEDKNNYPDKIEDVIFEEEK